MTYLQEEKKKKKKKKAGGLVMVHLPLSCRVCAVFCVEIAFETSSRVRIRPGRPIRYAVGETGTLAQSCAATHPHPTRGGGRSGA